MRGFTTDRGPTVATVLGLVLHLLACDAAFAACATAPAASTDGAVRFVGTLNTWTSVSGLGTAVAGDLVYDTTNNALSVCNGTAWQTVQTSAASGVPSGAVMAFNLSTCPSGWTEYTAARGRFVRGIDSTGANDPDGVRSLSSTQSDAFQGHTFNYTKPLLFDENGGTLSSQLARIPQSTTVGSPISDGTNGTPRTANETRPKNVALLYCQKN